MRLDYLASSGTFAYNMQSILRGNGGVSNPNIGDYNPSSGFMQNNNNIANGTIGTRNNFTTPQDYAMAQIGREMTTYDSAVREEIIQPVVDGTNTVGKVGYVAGVEMTAAGDIMRIGLGKDPYTWEDTDRLAELVKYGREGGFIYGVGKINKTMGKVVDYINDGKNIIEGYESIDKK